jgi:hypothetical protein
VSLPKGFHHSAATKARIRDALRGRVNGPHSLKTRKRISAAKKGKPNPKLRGRTLSAATIEKMSASLRGRKLSAAHVEAIRAARRGGPGYMLGKHHSEATRRRISQALKGRKKRRKQ